METALRVALTIAILSIPVSFISYIAMERADYTYEFWSVCFSISMCIMTSFAVIVCIGFLVLLIIMAWTAPI